METENLNEIKILIAENIPSLNKGEATILGGMQRSFERLGNVHLSMFSENPEIDMKNYPDINIIDTRKCFKLSNCKSNINKIASTFYVIITHSVFLFVYRAIGEDVRKIFKGELWEKYINSDIIIVGHDGAFGLGGGIVGSPLYFQPLFMTLFAKALKKPKIVLYGGSIPELTKPNLNLFRKPFDTILKTGLNNIDLIILRTNSSYNRLIELKVSNSNVLVLPDLGYLLRPSNSTKIEQIMIDEGINDKYPLVGIIITRANAQKAYPDLAPKKSYEKHIRLIAEIVDYLIDEYGAFVVFIPHCIGIYEELDDRLVARDIINLCNNKYAIKSIDTEYSAEELKGLLGKIDLVVSERIHAAVNAASMGTPTLVITSKSDERKDIINMIDEDAAIDLESLEKRLFLHRLSILNDPKKLEEKEDFLNKNLVEINEKTKLYALSIKDIVRV